MTRMQRLRHSGHLKFAMLFSLFGILGSTGYSVANFQAGLEKPTPAILASAESAGETLSLPKPISSYDQFMVTVDDDISVSVYARENPDATANIFLVHGAGGGAWVWEIFFENIPIDYNLYALSWRGHFDSSAVNDANSADYVADQDAALKAIAKRNNLPVHMIGHSYGGATSILQAAKSQYEISSVTLLAPVVPLDYDFAQRMIIPVVAPLFLDQGNDANGAFGGMFLSRKRMHHYLDSYAGKDHSKEKPSLIAGDGVSPKWQKRLAGAYTSAVDRGIVVSMYIARYDNVVVPRRQRLTASNNGIATSEIASGHYIPLDVKAKITAAAIAKSLRQLTSQQPLS